MPAGHGTAAAYERHGEWDGGGAAVEYLVTMTTRVPAGTSDAAVAEVRARESAHSRDLAEQGYLLRLWRPPLEPGEWRTLGLFSAENDEELETVLASMPLRVWRTDQVTPLSPHPNDPGVFVHTSE
jgi:muconolactone D-isomerase